MHALNHQKDKSCALELLKDNAATFLRMICVWSSAAVALNLIYKEMGGH